MEREVIRLTRDFIRRERALIAKARTGKVVFCHGWPKSWCRLQNSKLRVSQTDYWRWTAASPTIYNSLSELLKISISQAFSTICLQHSVNNTSFTLPTAFIAWLVHINKHHISQRGIQTEHPQLDCISFNRPIYWPCVWPISLLESGPSN